jgi:acetyl-CoA acetyltransferase
MAGIDAKDLAFAEVHDCFSITGVLMAEATGACRQGEGFDLVTSGGTKAGGALPLNLTGGLIGYGHYTGGTGIRQTIDNLKQLTGKAGDLQMKIAPEKPYGLVISMGGNDKTVTSFALRAAR